MPDYLFLHYNFNSVIRLRALGGSGRVFCLVCALCSIRIVGGGEEVLICNLLYWIENLVPLAFCYSGSSCSLSITVCLCPDQDFGGRTGENTLHTLHFRAVCHPFQFSPGQRHITIPALLDKS